MEIKKWIDKINREIDYLNKLEPKDRLNYISAIVHCANAIIGSVSGWEAWLTNPTLMENFKLEELKEIFNEFKKVTIGFLEYDIKWSEEMSSRLSKAKVDRARDYIS